MNLRRIPADVRSLATSLPRFLPGGREGALLLHGFTGTPRDLAALGGRLHEGGLSVSIPRLPGHGTSGRDFLQTGWRDWLRAAVDAFADLRARCDTAHLVGYSMGGILAVLLASRFPVGRLVLLAPALRARNPLLPLSPVLRLFFRRVRWSVTTTQAIDDPDYEAQAREYWRWRYAPQSASLLRLQRMAKRALVRVTSDTLTLLGDEDRAVPLSVIPFIEGRIGTARARHQVIEKATHLLLGGAQAERVIAQTCSWLTDPGRVRERRL
jgi:carboxylesterase